jgi:hypothetical protein
MLLHHSGYLGYKKENRKRLPISTAPLLSNALFLLPLLTGQDLSKVLNLQ